MDEGVFFFGTLRRVSVNVDVRGSPTNGIHLSLAYCACGILVPKRHEPVVAITFGEARGVERIQWTIRDIPIEVPVSAGEADQILTQVSGLPPHRTSG